MAPVAAPDTTTDPQAHGFIGQHTPISTLRPSKLNPRKHFDEFEMQELQANIAKHGVVLPIVARRRKDHIEILDGERRWKAAMAAGATTVPVVFRDEMTDSDAIEFMLLNSIQRQDLTPLEEANGFAALIASNKSKYSAAYIADRIGRNERYVWDRIKLLDADRILVGHAELLAKLKPEDQERVSKWRDTGYGGGVSGLWEEEDARLDFEGGKRPKPTVENLYAGLKPVTVKELETYIAEHVRFDVEHMAKAAPLEFGETKQAVEAAAAEPGRGKKVISITNDYRVDDAAKDPSERTYGSQSWRRADTKTCEFSVLGVFVAGPGYGTTLQVCVNRDKCTTHFGKVIKEREKNAKLRAQGKGGQAAQREKKASETSDQKWKREQAERQAKQKAWAAIWPHVLKEALRQVDGVKALTQRHAKAIEDSFDIMVDTRACKHAGITWWKNVPHALLVSEIYRGEYQDGFTEFAKEVAAPLDLDIKKLEAVRDQHAPKDTAPAKAAAPKKAKKR